MALNLNNEIPAADRQAIFLRETEPRAARPERCRRWGDGVDRLMVEVVNGRNGGEFLLGLFVTNRQSLRRDLRRNEYEQEAQDQADQSPFDVRSP
jgi:hypothetical protein